MSLGLIYFVGDALRERCRTELVRGTGPRLLDWPEASGGALPRLPAASEGPDLLLDVTGGPSGPALAQMPPDQMPPGLAELHAAGRTRAIAAIEPAALFAALAEGATAGPSAQACCGDEHDHHRHHHHGEACGHDHGHEHHDHAHDHRQSHAMARAALFASIEYADRLVVDARELGADELLRLRRMLRSLNGGAEIVLHTDPTELARDLAALPPGHDGVPAWQMLQAGHRPPEFATLGLEALIHRTRTPFSGARLAELMRRDIDGVYRAVGQFWLATRPDLVCAWSRCGTLSVAHPVGLWWASMPRDRWPTAAAAAIERRWREPFGDRQQEFVFIGHGFDAGEIRGALDACALSEAELALGPKGWAQLPDPFPAWATAQH